jgi:hypothetical protein
MEYGSMAKKAGDHILGWLDAEHIAAAYGEQIVGRARELLIASETGGQLPKQAAPAAMPVTEVIRRSKPQGSDEVSFTETAALWPARWLFFAFPDTSVDYRALDLAWAQLIKR